MSEIVFVIIGIIIIVLKIDWSSSTRKDPFRYVWDIDILNDKYNTEVRNDSSTSHLDELYQNASKRIRDRIPYAREYLPSILQEAEHILGRKRSYEQLKKKTWEYIKYLARLAGYEEEEVYKDEFYCPGWNKIQALYSENKDRILNNNPSSKNAPSQNNPRTSYSKKYSGRIKHLFRESLYELQRSKTRNELENSYRDSMEYFSQLGEKIGWDFSNSIEEIALTALYEALFDSLPEEESSKTNYSYSQNWSYKEEASQEDNTKSAQESIKEKNRRIFEGIWDIGELKKKYYRLAKLNHPDHGGNHKAMQLLNKYYTEALERIQSRENSSY